MSRLHWAVIALASAASFAAMAACVRMACDSLPQSEVVFFRNFMALLLLLPMLWQQKVSLKSERMGLHLMRAGTGLAAMYLYFYALKHLPLAGALLLNYTSPLFLAIIALFWLKERSTRTRTIAVVLGFLGVATLFSPSSSIASFAGLMGLASGFLAGVALATVKRLSSTEPAIRTVTWFALLASLISFVPMVPEYQWPSVETWGWLIAVGIFANGGQLFLTTAYGMAPVTQVSPLGYTGLIFAGIIGFAVWDEIPGLFALLGAVLIITAGILVTRERTEPMPEPPGSVPAVKINGRS